MASKLPFCLLRKKDYCIGLGFGYKTYIVSSGSMEPFLQVGDIILVDKVESANDISTNDIITFSQDQGKDITHRVIEIKEVNGNRLFITKGDNNNSADSNEVEFGRVRGKYSGKIDGIGKFILNVKTSFGAIIPTPRNGNKALLTFKTSA